MAIHRTARPQGAPTVLLQARVAPEAHAAVKDAAARSGVTLALYMESLVRILTEETGEMPLVPNPKDRQREELPIPAA